MRELGRSVNRSTSFLGVDTFAALLSKLASGAEASSGTASEPEIIDIDKNLPIPEGANFLVAPNNNYLFRFVGGKHLIFEGATGVVTFHGKGIADPAMKQTYAPCFMNAPVNGYSDEDADAGEENAKGVKWSNNGGAAQMPIEISPNVFGFSAGNSLGIATDSLSARIKRVELAFPLTHRIKVIVSPGTVDAQVMMRWSRFYYFLYGVYPFTFAGAADTDITQHGRLEPFFYYCPKDTSFFARCEDGTEFHLSDDRFHKTLFQPTDNENLTEVGHLSFKNFRLFGERNHQNGEGRNLIRFGNCQSAEADGFYIEGCQDYPFTMGGDARNFFRGRNIKVKNVHIIDNYNYTTHGLNYHNGLLEDYLIELLTLQANMGGTTAGDEEPNGTEENIKKGTYRRVFFYTNQGSQILSDPNRQFTFVMGMCYISHGATDGIEEFTYDECGYECPSKDGDGNPEFLSVQSGILAEGHYDLKILNFKAKGGGANGQFKLERCRKVLIENPEATDTYSGKIHLIGTGETTIKIEENKVSCLTGKKIVEEEWGHTLLVNGNVWLMADSWLIDEGRPYLFYEKDGGWKFDYMNQTARIQSYTSTRNITNYPFKKLTADVSVGSKTAITMSSISGDTITATAHGLTTGEPLDYDSTGNYFTQLIENENASAGITGEPRRVYAIVLTANTFKLANSLRNAFAGTAISGFTGGSGTHTLQRFYLTAKSFLPAAVDLTNNRVNVPGHNLVKATAVQYRNYDTSGNDTADAIGGLYKASTNENQVTREINGSFERWAGFYWVFPDPADPTNYLKFAETKPDALAETAIDLTDDGTGFHYILPVAMTDNSDSNRYFIPSDWTVEKRNPLSQSQVFYPQNENTPVATLPAGVPLEISAGMTQAQINSNLQAQISLSIPLTYLLDEISVQPRKAFSIRKLKSDYSGACLKARAAGSSAAWIDIGWNGVWVNNAALAAVTGYPNLEILFYNQGADGINEAQHNSEREPTLTINAINGRPARTFDMDELTIQNYLSLGNLSAYTAGEVARVVYLAEMGANSSFWDLGTNANPNHFPYSGDGNVYSDFGSTSRVNLGNPDTLIDKPLIGFWRLWQEWSALNDRGAVVDTAELYSNQDAASNTVGFQSTAILHSDRLMYEVMFLLFNEKLSTDDRALIQTESKKYFIGASSETGLDW